MSMNAIIKPRPPLFHLKSRREKAVERAQRLCVRLSALGKSSSSQEVTLPLLVAPGYSEKTAARQSIHPSPSFIPSSVSIHDKVLDEPIPTLRPPVLPLLRKKSSQDGTLALAAGNMEKIQMQGSMEYGPVPPPPQRGQHPPSLVPSSTVVHAAFGRINSPPSIPVLPNNLIRSHAPLLTDTRLSPQGNPPEYELVHPPPGPPQQFRHGPPLGPYYLPNMYAPPLPPLVLPLQAHLALPADQSLIIHRLTSDDAPLRPFLRFCLTTICLMVERHWDVYRQYYCDSLARLPPSTKFTEAAECIAYRNMAAIDLAMMALTQLGFLVSHPKLFSFALEWFSVRTRNGTSQKTSRLPYQASLLSALESQPRFYTPWTALPDIDKIYYELKASLETHPTPFLSRPPQLSVRVILLGQTVHWTLTAHLVLVPGDGLQSIPLLVTPRALLEVLTYIFSRLLPLGDPHVTASSSWVDIHSFRSVMDRYLSGPGNFHWILESYTGANTHVNMCRGPKPIAKLAYKQSFTRPNHLKHIGPLLWNIRSHRRWTGKRSTSVKIGNPISITLGTTRRKTTIFIQKNGGSDNIEKRIKLDLKLNALGEILNRGASGRKDVVRW
ncbi:hypothetical protein ARMSODRAFT_983007 [Armillaria solidipes]|uniref:Uncharacterized protein n=1 Tax=Armillaria solidipes TaxID=1076256 RepID=A0A2H3AXE5_9AGAR|nr:hypothetical protein ARMSODRAFT_983007 [Armillaria solidipes]